MTRSKTTNVRSLSTYVGNYSTPSLRMTGFERKRSSESPVKLSRTIENSLDIKDARENLVEQEFYNRLISAHHRVDELLKSRGLNTEDKKPSFENDYSYTPRQDTFNITARSFRKATRNQTNILEKTKNCYADIGLESTRRNLSASLFFPLSTTEEKVNFATCSSTIEVEPDSVSKDELAFLSMNISPVTRVHLSVKSPRPVIDSHISQALKKGTKWLHDCSAAPIRFGVRSDNKAGCSDNKDELIIRKSFFLNRARQLRTVFRQAEVSIQHCSFYKVSKRFENHENCVRLNLRLTERTPLNLNASIVIIAEARPISIREYFVEPSMSTNSTDKFDGSSTRMRSDSTHLNYTVQILKDTQNEKRKIRRLRIPDQFLNITAENSNCPSLIGGFIYDCPVPKKSPNRFKLSISTNQRTSSSSSQQTAEREQKDDAESCETQQRGIELTAEASNLSSQIELKALPKMFISIDKSSHRDHVQEHPVLRKTSQNSRQISKENKIFDIPIRLKKVDHSIIRPRIVFDSHNKWVPSWRKPR
ncbi:unnamed protein product [Auanema sp. JU1783]|nr:unnamed protein product [Auanema sp. JU1783]